MPGSSSAKTRFALLPGHDECRHLDSIHTFVLATRCARGLDLFSARRGRGERRVPVAPAVSCALGSGRTHTSNNEYTGIARRSRTQWFYDLFRALPGDRALLPPSHADMSCLSPV